MARQARGSVEAGIYHVTMRSTGPIELFRDDTDRHMFCTQLARVIEKYSWMCRAFCLMTTHYHLIVEVDTNRLQPGMHDLNGPYAQEFNKRHGRSGHLRGDRYHAEQILTDGHMLRAFRYVERNPVKAGLRKHPALWMWSSYRGHAGLDNGFPFVDREWTRVYFGQDRNDAIRNIRALVEDE